MNNCGITDERFTGSQSFALSAATFFTFLKLTDASVAASVVALSVAATAAFVAALHDKTGLDLCEYKAAAVPLSISCASSAALAVQYLAEDVSSLYGDVSPRIFFVGASVLTLFIALAPRGALGRFGEILFAPALFAAVFSVIGEGDAKIPKTPALRGIYAAALIGVFMVLVVNSASSGDITGAAPKKRIFRALPVIAGAAVAAAIYVLLLFFGSLSGVFSVLMKWDVLILGAASAVSVSIRTALKFRGVCRALFAVISSAAFVFVAFFGEKFDGALIFAAASVLSLVGICVFSLTKNKKES